MANRGRGWLRLFFFFKRSCATIDAPIVPRLKRGKQKPQRTRGLRCVPRLPRLISLSKRFFFFRRADYLRPLIPPPIVAIVASLWDEGCQCEGRRPKKKSRKVCGMRLASRVQHRRSEYPMGICKE